jgi:hypothetical protein
VVVAHEVAGLGPDRAGVGALGGAEELRGGQGRRDGAQVDGEIRLLAAPAGPVLSLLDKISQRRNILTSFRLSNAFTKAVCASRRFPIQLKLNDVESKNSDTFKSNAKCNRFYFKNVSNCLDNRRKFNF